MARERPLGRWTSDMEGGDGRREPKSRRTRRRELGLAARMGCSMMIKVDIVVKVVVLAGERSE